MGKVILPGIVEPLTKPRAIYSVLNDNDWQTISEVSQAGEAANYWSVGDTKTIVINGQVGSYTTFSNLSIDVFILGINHNSSIEGTNTIHFGLGKINGEAVALVDSKYNSGCNNAPGYFSMSSSTYNCDPWDECQIRTSILGSDSTPTSPTANTLLAALPADLKAVMRPVSKYSHNNLSGNWNKQSDVTATTDYLPLLAEFEIFGVRKNANSYEQNKQAQYDYYKAGNSPGRAKHNVTGEQCGYWTRSLCNSYTSGASEYMCNCTSAGVTGYSSPVFSQGVAPLFVV